MGNLSTIDDGSNRTDFGRLADRLGLTDLLGDDGVDALEKKTLAEGRAIAARPEFHENAHTRIAKRLAERAIAPKKQG